MVLIVGAAAAMMRAPHRKLIAAAALGGLALSLPDTVAMARYNVIGSPAADAQTFARSARTMGRGAPLCAADRARRQ